MFIPIDEAEFNANIEGAIKSLPVMDYDPKDPSASDRQKMAGPAGKKLPAWVVEVMYSDPLDLFDAGSEKIEVRINSAEDPAVRFGPIMLGGVRCSTWEMNGKFGLTWSCATFTQEPKPSKGRAANPAPEVSTASK